MIVRYITYSVCRVFLQKFAAACRGRPRTAAAGERAATEVGQGDVLQSLSAAVSASMPTEPPPARLSNPCPVPVLQEVQKLCESDDRRFSAGVVRISAVNRLNRIEGALPTHVILKALIVEPFSAACLLPFRELSSSAAGTGAASSCTKYCSPSRTVSASRIGQRAP